MKRNKIKLIDITNIRFSPEFEFEVSNKIDAEKLIERGKTLKGWNIKFDASLDNGIELSPSNSNKLYYNEDSLLQIKEILALCRVYKAKALPNCGLHVHINAKNMTDKQILTIINEWIHKQNFIVKRFNISKERLENTCKLLPREELYKLTEKMIHEYRNDSDYNFKSYKYLDDKYRSLNVNHLPVNDYGTLEFRLFPATLNFKEIKSIVYFLLNFIKDSLERE